MRDNLRKAIDDWKSSTFNDLWELRDVKQHKQESGEFLLIISQSGSFNYEGKNEHIQGLKFFLTFAQQSRKIDSGNELSINSNGDLILFKKCCELCDEDFLNKASNWLEKISKELLSNNQ